MSSKISPFFMKNPATHRPRSDQFNEFTGAIYYRYVSEQKTTLVTLRNGSIVEVYWFDEDGEEYASFASDTGISYRWNRDGTSITYPDYDMMTTFV